VTALAPGQARLAIDVGGTSIKAVGIDAAGRVRHRADVPTPRGGDVLAALAEVIDGFVTTLAADGLTIVDIGLACPGLVDTDRGIVRLASNLGWRDLSLGAWMSERYGTVARIDNDARAGALAEQALLAPLDGSRLAFIPIGTGVSAAYFTDGVLVRGATSAAGEFGHVRVVPDGDLCSCGNRGCLEAYASAANIAARYRRSSGLVADTPTIVASVGSDPVAAGVWADAVESLAAALVSLIALLDPSTVVIGGGLSRAGDALIAPLVESVRTGLPWRTPPTISASTLAPDSTLIGASLLGTDMSVESRGMRVRDIAAQLRVREGAMPR
jgi:glucokinase